MMKHLGQRYVQYINRTYRRSGTVREGRILSCLTQIETCMLACYRYIGLNPVRARMVEYPAEYAWSSYRYNDQGLDNTLLSPHPLQNAPGQSKEDVCRRYRALFYAHIEHGLIDEIRRTTNGNYVFGDERFINEIELILRRRVTPGKAGRPLKD